MHAVMASLNGLPDAVIGMRFSADRGNVAIDRSEAAARSDAVEGGPRRIAG